MTELPEGLPPIVYLGFRRIKIVPWEVSYSDDRSAHGEHSSTMQEVRVCFERPNQPAATLLHELMHACWHFGALKEGDDEERIITSLGHTMASMISQNPSVFKWIMDNLGEPTQHKERGT